MATEIQSQGPHDSHVLLQELVRDIVIGLADGLTVPFALAAGLAGSLPNTQLVVTAGLAEIAAGCIAMGLGAYLAVTLRDSGIPPDLAESVVEAISNDTDKWLRFLLKNQGIEHPSPRRARNSSLTIGLSYIIGGMIPLLPYWVVSNSHLALACSVVITLCALFVFGIAKARILGTVLWKSAVQTALVGGLAAASIELSSA